MTGFYSQSATSYYNNADLYGSVESVDQHGLITLLYNGLLKNIHQATNAVQLQDVQTKCNAINKSLDILDALRSRLNFEIGGKLADNLDSLYEYMQRRLVIANRDADVGALNEVAGLIDEIKQAWIALPGLER